MSQENQGYIPSIIVKFRDDKQYFADPRHYVDSALEKVANPVWRQRWETIARSFPEIRLRRLFRLVSPQKIQALTRQAELMDAAYRNAKKPCASNEENEEKVGLMDAAELQAGHSNLLTYFAVDVPPSFPPAKIDELIRVLRAWDELIEDAYLYLPGAEPGVSPGDDDEFEYQDYLLPAYQNGGIDMLKAWSCQGGDGANQMLIDFERGWNLGHPDLPGDRIEGPIGGEIADENDIKGHGTKVLGVICARDNDNGCVGITPNLSTIKVASYWDKERSDVLLAAVERLPLGGILLIEAELAGQHYPIEKQPDEYDAIRLATALGIVVVAAAGNGRKRLDNNPQRDSGAILVAAATPPLNDGSSNANVDEFGVYKPGRDERSNFGSRINCYAWGGGVRTTSLNGYGDIWQTSAAAAIIAGAALVVQGIIHARYNVRIDGWRMREILSDVALGTPAKPEAEIRAMPDLNKIIAALPTLSLPNYIGPVVDLYLRDFNEDAGDPFSLPPGNDAFFSPDILVNGVSPNSAIQIEKGASHQIRLRAWNRGGMNSIATPCYVYLWDKQATNSANRLIPIGTTSVEAVPPGSSLLTPEVNWIAPTTLSSEKEYYLVGLIDKAAEVNGLPPYYGKSEIENLFKKKSPEFLQRFISRINNIAMHKIQVAAM